MNILFVNTVVQQCGVYQYGISLFENLYLSKEIHYDYFEADSEPHLRAKVQGGCYRAIIYNWHPNIGGWMAAAPFVNEAKQVMIYHDGEIAAERFDAVLFSDPTMRDHGNWYAIPRPIPVWSVPAVEQKHDAPTIGSHGFLGAWTPILMDRVRTEFQRAKVRLVLPYARFGDADGALARQASDYCRSVSGNGIEVEICNEFLDRPELLKWLSNNDLNCYFRETDMHWRGVASAPDFALAVRKPIAVNRCNAFRHLHGCHPSICIEDRSLWEIRSTGTGPLDALYEAFSAEAIRSRMRHVLKVIEHSRSASKLTA